MGTSGNLYCYHFDRNANTVAVTDISQNVVNCYAYDFNGAVTSQVEAVPQPFKFVGQFGVMPSRTGSITFGQDTTIRRWGGVVCNEIPMASGEQGFQTAFSSTPPSPG